MAEVRALTSRGIQEFYLFIQHLAAGEATEIPLYLLTDHDTSQSVDVTVEIESQTFASKLEAASYLASALKDLPRAEIDHNQGLWSWVALFYFDVLCPAGADGRRVPRDVASYIPPALTDSLFFMRYYRHLLAGPYRLLRLHPECAPALLSGPVHVHPDLIEQLASSQELITNSEFIKAVVELYFTQQAGGSWIPKRGITNRKKPGTLRRLKEVVNQLDLTYDVYGLRKDQIVQLLPTEFSRWVPAQRVEVATQG